MAQTLNMDAIRALAKRRPTRTQLEALGRWARARGLAAPDEIDARLDALGGST